LKIQDWIWIAKYDSPLISAHYKCNIIEQKFHKTDKKKKNNREIQPKENEKNTRCAIFLSDLAVFLFVWRVADFLAIFAIF